MKQICKKGEHDFRPNSLGFTAFDFDVIWRVDFTESCFYDKSVLGPDVSDWNKAGGIGRVLTENNKDCILLAWRPSQHQAPPMAFESCIYVNDKRGGFTTGLVFQYMIGEVPYMRATRRGGSLTFSAGIIHSDSLELIEFDTYQTAMRGILRDRGAWFGGTSPAPWDMELWVSKTKYHA